MNKFLAILTDSLLEITSRKIIFLYAALTLFMVLIIVLIPNFKIDGQSVMGSDLVSPELITEVLAGFIDAFLGFLIFLMVFGSAGFLPSYLKKGRVELLLSKPINRMTLLTMKFLAVYIIMCAIMAIVTTIIWLAISIRLGYFSGYYFYGLLFAFVYFLVIYIIIFAIGTASRSGAIAIMGYFIIRIATDLLMGREVVYGFLGDSVWKTVLNTVYHIAPKMGEMAGNFEPLMRGEGFVNTYPVFSTLGFAVVVFLATLLVFQKRDY
nr:hypothetical protein [candidate division Zixibacteria bacterium]